MKKFIAIILSVTVVLAMLTGCGAKSVDEPGVDNRFKLVEAYKTSGRGSTSIYVDAETGVMYMYVKVGNSGGLTVMVDSDGAPLVWDVGH